MTRNRWKNNAKQKGNGLELLQFLLMESVSAVFFDPQYKSLLDKQNYGNFGKTRGAKQAKLSALSDEEIGIWLKEIERILRPSAYCFLWVDKFTLVTGWYNLFSPRGDVQLKAVDMITWHKKHMGMGYRSRRCSEHLLVLQKAPIKAKVTWRDHSIPDVWYEHADTKLHPHAKPIALQTRLINSVSYAEDLIVDPAAGSYSVLQACLDSHRWFIGCDING